MLVSVVLPVEPGIVGEPEGKDALMGGHVVDEDELPCLACPQPADVGVLARPVSV